MIVVVLPLGQSCLIKHNKKLFLSSDEKCNQRYLRRKIYLIKNKEGRRSYLKTEIPKSSAEITFSDKSLVTCELDLI